MLNMSQINHIRDLKKKGYKISEIHEETGVDPKTIKKYLDQSDFSPEIPKAVKALAESMDTPLAELPFLYEPIETWKIN